MKTKNEINEEIQFNSELMGLLDVMKNIAVFRFRTLQMKKKRFPRFAEALEGFFGAVDLKKVKHPFINPAAEKAAIMVITSDAGFMGGLNLKVLEAALTAPEAERAEIIVVGERGTHYLSDIGRSFTAFRSAASFEERYHLSVELKDHILKGAKAGRFGKVLLFYPKPVSFIVQKVEALKLLPVTLPEMSFLRKQESLLSQGQVYVDSRFRGNDSASADIIIESPLEGIIDYLTEEDMIQKLIDALEDSKLSEFASRAIHLEESTRELKEKEKGLRFQYFRVYHELIDKNIRELFSAQVIGRRR